MKCPNCNLDLVPVKINIKGFNVRIKYSCWKCKNKFEEFLKFKDRKNWIPILRHDIFRCDNCGEYNEDWAYLDNFQKLMENDNDIIKRFQFPLKIIVFNCKCGHRNKKIIRDEIWYHLKIE